MKDKLLQQLDKVEKLACSSKLSRLINNPYKYSNAIFFKTLTYPLTKRELFLTADLFWGNFMHIALPASTDIYITGGKSHDSEIRLARFLILNLNEGNNFLDIGAHYGYFALLASQLVGDKGLVYAFEPSNKNFSLLKQNCEKESNIKFFQQAISNELGQISFFEFPNLYSEYNSINTGQFTNEEWYSKNKPEKISVEAKTIDSIVSNGSFSPNIIKIDVEGAEYKALSGASTYLQTHVPIIAMEYLCAERDNNEHVRAVGLLRSFGYKTYYIDHSGQLIELDNIDAYLEKMNLESDNIIFKK